MLQCPLPKFDHDIITLGHGSGGLLMHRLLEQTVFSVFGNEILDQQHDGASFTLEGRLAFSTDSYVVSPIFFPGGNIGDLAVNGTVNDLAMCGADARYLSLAFILEEGLRMEEFWLVLNSIKSAAQASGIQIVTGDTKVVERGKGDKLFINTSGIGAVHPAARIHHRFIQAGDVILLSGKLANHGIAIMSRRQGLEFETDILTDSINLNHTVMSLLDQFGSAIRFLRDPTRGGLASTLNEMAGSAQLGVSVLQSELPLDEQVEGACEMLGLDPLYVANEGIFIAVLAPEQAEAALQALRLDPNGKNAAIIGQVTGEHTGKVVLKSRIGGQRVVNYLPGEQLPRIC
jgi:hydrogenase expression/formation protein HypE